MGLAALDLARNGWEVFPLKGKAPAIRDGHGVLDATDDLDQVAAWWSRFPTANIGGRVPAGLLVVDVDPRNGGEETRRELWSLHGLVLFPTELVVISGRGDGGGHYYLLHPGGKVRASIGRGIDVKTSSGYMVMPPSIHPETGRPYVWGGRGAPGAPAGWLLDRLRPPAAPPPRRPSPRDWGVFGGDSIADLFCAGHTWSDVLARHGWRCVSGDGESDGSRWRHPTATAAFSATVKHGLLFCYSTTPGLPVTEPESPAGLTKFRALAHLEFGGDLSATARALRTGEVSA